MPRHADVSDELCDKICCSDFLNLPPPPDASTWTFKLTNSVHTLFTQSKFHRFDGETLEPLDQATYDKLIPALKLATCMLSADSAVHYVCTMHDGTLHKEISPNSESTALEWSEIDAVEAPFDGLDEKSLPQAKLTRRPLKTVSSAESMRDRSAQLLEQLDGVLASIMFVDQSQPGKTVHFGPNNRRYGRLDDVARKNFPRAMATHIKLSTSATKIDEEVLSSRSLYVIARLIVHELGHVMNKAFNGYRKEEVFYQNSCTNESGFELENALFGGICEEYDLQNYLPDLFTSPTPCLISETWPSPRVFEWYAGKPYDFSRRRDCGQYVNVVRLTPTFLAALCDDFYWALRARAKYSSPVLDTRLIEPPSTTAYKWIVSVDENYYFDFRTHERDLDAMPENVRETCEDIYASKQARIERGREAAARPAAEAEEERCSPEATETEQSPEEEEERCSPETAETEQSPQQHTGSYGEPPFYGTIW